NPAPQVFEAAPTWMEAQAPCGAGFMPAGGGGAVAKGWTSPPSAGIHPAPQVFEAAPTWMVVQDSLWGRPHAGRRRSGHRRGLDFTAVGRDQPGPARYSGRS